MNRFINLCESILHTMEKETVETTSEEMERKNYHRLKIRLQEMERRRKIAYALVAFLGFILVFKVITEYSDISLISLDFSSILIAFFGCCVLAGWSFLCIKLVYEIQEGNLREKIFEYEADNMQEEVIEDIFENSIKMSYKYLDQYYLQTRVQAQRGFLVTVCVAVFGAFLIFAGVITMFLGWTKPSYVTCASGVITEFIAAIFFYLYNRTVSSMSKYHNKLVLSQNVSIALKIAESLPETDRVKTKNLVVTELLKNINSYLVKSDDKAGTS